jgi:hypothetical protein
MTAYPLGEGIMSRYHDWLMDGADGADGADGDPGEMDEHLVFVEGVGTCLPLPYDHPVVRRRREILALEARIAQTSSLRKRLAWQEQLDALRADA